MNEGFNIFAKQAIKEQGLPFKMSKNSNVEYMNKNTLNELYDKSTKNMGKLIRSYQNNTLKGSFILT